MGNKASKEGERKKGGSGLKKKNQDDVVKKDWETYTNPIHR